MFGLMAIAAAAFAPVAAGAPSRWQVETDKRCAIALRPADPAKDIALKIAVPVAADEIFVSFENPGWVTSPVHETDRVKLSLEPGGVASAADLWFGPGNADGGVPSLTLGVTGRDFLARLATARTLVVIEEAQVIAQLPLGDQAGAVAALRACQAARQKRWGIDPNFWAALRSGPALIGPGGYLTSEDYPKDALAAHASGRVTVRLNVDASGIPAGCAVVESSGNDSLDQTTCRLLVARARFRPAVDAEAKAVAAPYVMSIEWRAPG
ncbi:MAG TPA: energy transducer TonB [Allosphingosinicella sp.]|nr:energy transducer TonB [Allosphingosinicella sp.]